MTRSIYQPVIPERMIWTSSSLRTFRRDKRKFYWKYIMRLSPVFRDRHLMIGSAVHEGIAKWYRARRVSVKMIADGLMESLRKEVDTNVSYYDQSDYDDAIADIETIGGILDGYTTHYESDRKSLQIPPDQVEYSFIVDMGDFDYAGQMDGVCDRVVEHKTSGNPNAAYFERLPLDTQIRGYVFAARKTVSPKISKVLYNVIRKPKLRRKAGEEIADYTARIRQDYLDRPTFYFHRLDLTVTKKDLANFEREIRQTHAEYEAILKTGRAHEPEAWLPNDSECASYFRLCPFFSMCVSGVAGGAAFVRQRSSMHEELKDLE